MSAEIRAAVEELLALGPMPDETATTPDQVAKYQQQLEAITPPVSNVEARLLLSLFGSDTYFGLTWSLLHLIETADRLPLDGPPAPNANRWVRLLWESSLRGKPLETTDRS